MKFEKHFISKNCRVTVTSIEAEIWIFPINRFDDAVYNGFFNFVSDITNNEGLMSRIGDQFAWRKMKKKLVADVKGLKEDFPHIGQFQQY